MSLSPSATSPAAIVSPTLASSTAKTATRLLAIDALRGFVMYPPSLMFLLPTLGLGLILLGLFEKLQARASIAVLAVYGGAPMFFYLLHLYVLKAMYLLAVFIWGTNQGAYFGFDHLPMVWLWSAVLGVVLFFPTRWFASLKQRRRDISMLKYF